MRILLFLIWGVLFAADDDLAQLQAANPGVHFHAITAVVTAYTPCAACCGAGAKGITSTGVDTRTTPHGIAGPTCMVGSLVHIPGYLVKSNPGKFWKVDDTGGALNTDWNKRQIYHFDVRFVNYEWAKKWGRREITVYVADPAE